MSHDEEEEERIIVVTYRDEKGVIRASHGLREHSLTGVTLSDDTPMNLGARFDTRLGEFVL